MSILFFISVFLLFHSYILYPFLLWLLTKSKGLCFQHYEADDTLPDVAIVMAVHNEELVIKQKVESIFASDYPLHKLSVFVGSDCSTDKTNQILEQLSQKYLQLSVLRFEKRQGKVSVINQLVNRVESPIIISTDANVMFSNNTIYQLVKYFKDQAVGLVDSRMKNSRISKTGISIPESTYITHEVMIKHREGLLWGSMIGPFGGCYAIRRELFCAPPVNTVVDDFYISMKVLEQNRKCINNLDAIATEDVSNKLSEEFRRKVRIGVGNFQNLKQFANLLWPPFKPVAFAFLSHKIIRWFGPFIILTAIASLTFLSINSAGFSILLYLLIGLLLVPAVDIVLNSFKINISPIRFVTHFFSMNLALFLGLIKYLKGVNSNVWQPTQRNQ